MPTIDTLIQLIGCILWDVGLSVYNLLTPALQIGHVVPKGHPGAGGTWPEFIAPQKADSRGSCPALNAMANHGILPRDGKNIPFTELTKVIRTTYNFAPSFCRFVPLYAASYLGRNYNKDTFDLAELDLHNDGIEHDASLLREDVYFNRDQSTPHVPFINELLESASGKGPNESAILLPDDLAQFAAKRRLHSQKENPEFTMLFVHRTFGSANASTMLTIFGGYVKDLETFLIEERIPDGWESKIRSRKGLTIQAFNGTVLPVESKTKKIVANALKSS